MRQPYAFLRSPIKCQYKRLGYKGFSEFQSVFRRAVAEGNRCFYSRQAGRLLAAGAVGAGAETFERIARESIANIESCLAGLELQTAQAAAKLLASARRVRFHGERQFHSFARFGAYRLAMIRADVGLLDAARLGLAEALSGLSIDDVAVVSSCAPYTRSVVEVAETAARFGVRVIAVTDFRSSSLVAPAQQAFFVPYASSFFSNSMGAYAVFAEGLLNLVAHELGEAALAALARRCLATWRSRSPDLSVPRTHRTASRGRRAQSASITQRAARCRRGRSPIWRRERQPACR